MQPNKHIQTLKPYIPIAQSIYEQTSSDVLKLDWNEATMPPSPHVMRALYQALHSTHLHWYPHTHNHTLLSLLSDYTKQPISNLAIFASSDTAHEYFLRVFAREAQSICIIAPTYDNFRSSAQGHGLVCEFFYLNDDGSLDIAKLDSYLSSHMPSFVYICNPNNPTGTLHPIHKLHDLMQHHSNIGFLIDEAYYEFSDPSHTLAPYIDTLPNLFITRTFSKAFALASCRIGYIISTKENINALHRLRNPKQLPQLSQIAAIAALQDIAHMRAYVAEVSKAREYFTHELKAMNIAFYPSSANFILMHLNNADGLLSFLASRHIYIRNYAHILPEHVRISIGTLAQMKRVCEAMKAYITTHTSAQSSINTEANTKASFMQGSSAQSSLTLHTKAQSTSINASNTSVLNTNDIAIKESNINNVSHAQDLDPASSLQKSSVLAIFDFCDTLVKGQTLAPFLALCGAQNPNYKASKSLLARLSRKMYARIASKLMAYLPMQASSTPPHYPQLARLPLHIASHLAVQYAASLKEHCHQHVIKQLQWHKSKGHKILVISGGLAMYIRPFMQELGVDCVLAIELEEIYIHQKACLSGMRKGLHTMSWRKLYSLESALPLHTYNLQESYVYSDCPSDIPLLSLVGNPCVIQGARSDEEIRWAKILGYNIL